MRRAALLVIGLITIIGIFAGARSAQAQFGAIAYDRANCAWGRSWNFASPREAAAVALAECRYAGCQVILEIGPHQCGSLASTVNCRGYGWATSGSRSGAQYAALQACVRYNAGECIARVGDCNR